MKTITEAGQVSVVRVLIESILQQSHEHVGQVSVVWVHVGVGATTGECRSRVMRVNKHVGQVNVCGPLIIREIRFSYEKSD